MRSTQPQPLGRREPTAGHRRRVCRHWTWSARGPPPHRKTVLLNQPSPRDWVVALKTRWLTALTAILLALVLTATVAAPSQANLFLAQKNRTIYSPNYVYSQVWHIQFWQRTPLVANYCYIFGRSLMDSFNKTYHPPIDYLDSVRIWDQTTGVEAVPGSPADGFPPIAIQTRGSLTLRAGSTHYYRVRGTARVRWWGYSIGPTGVHEYYGYITCTNVATSSGNKAVIKVTH